MPSKKVSKCKDECGRSSYARVFYADGDIEYFLFIDNNLSSHIRRKPRKHDKMKLLCPYCREIFEDY